MVFEIDTLTVKLNDLPLQIVSTALATSHIDTNSPVNASEELECNKKFNRSLMLSETKQCFDLDLAEKPVT